MLVFKTRLIVLVGCSECDKQVDCTVHRRVCSRFGVNGYPTLYYVNNGQVYKYQGGRTLPAYVCSSR